MIAHCVDAPRWAVLDDRAARRCAAAHDVRVIGTLGVILRTKKRGEVESARPLVKKLVAAGMFIGEKFVEGVLCKHRGMRRVKQLDVPRYFLCSVRSRKPIDYRSRVFGKSFLMLQAHVGLFRTSCGHLTFFFEWSSAGPLLTPTSEA